MEYIVILFILIIAFFLIRLTIFKKKFVSPTGLAVFISGCDTGIGNCLAKYFDSLGCDVYAGCLSSSSSISLPETVTVIPLNTTDEDSVQKAVDQVKRNLREKGKDLWALINNAGVCVYGEFEWQTWNQIQKQIDVNLLGTMRLSKSFIPLLRKRKGRIITITSVNGSIAYPGLSVYSATKFALEGFSHALRVELSRLHGIKVIIVQPGDLARLTCIMSQHERNAQEMWQNLSENDQNQYGEFFHKYHRVTMKNFGLTSPQRFEDSRLFEDMKDALLNRNPKIRYIASAMHYKIFYQLLSLTPFFLVDKFLNMISDILFKSDDGGKQVS